jgi:hypothetical protein
VDDGNVIPSGKATPPGCGLHELEQRMISDDSLTNDTLVNRDRASFWEPGQLRVDASVALIVSVLYGMPAVKHIT